MNRTENVELGKYRENDWEWEINLKRFVIQLV